MSEAAWALAGVLVGGLTTGFFNWLLQTRQFEHSVKMHRLEHQSTENVKSILLAMLNHRTHIDRSFGALSRPIGGYSDDEIRKLLHEIEAKRVERPGGEEFWYLQERQGERARERDGRGD